MEKSFLKFVYICIQIPVDEPTVTYELQVYNVVIPHVHTTPGTHALLNPHHLFSPSLGSIWTCRSAACFEISIVLFSTWPTGRETETAVSKWQDQRRKHIDIASTCTEGRRNTGKFILAILLGSHKHLPHTFLSLSLPHNSLGSGFLHNACREVIPEVKKNFKCYVLQN